jgi:hypothetical protein
MFCLGGMSHTAWAQFETRARHLLPANAYDTAFGDFNGDGILDVAVLDNVLSVLLGNGDGTFQKPVTYSRGAAYSLAVADFNQDGKPDIVVANVDSSSVSVYLGNGDGSFQPAVDSPTTFGSYSLAVGDFNSDGKPDVTIIDPPYVSVLLGRGDGTFGAPSDNRSFVGPQRFAVGDFNNDHRLDVVVTGVFGGSQYAGVLLGNGDGTLQDSITDPLIYTPGEVAVGDFNGDGKLDAVVTGYLGELFMVLIGNGDGSFQAPEIYTTVVGGAAVVADFNGDGKLDLVFAAGSVAGVDEFLGNGNGSFQNPISFASGRHSGVPIMGDLNNDGKADLLLVSGIFGLITMLHTGSLSFTPSAPVDFDTQVINTQSSPQTVTLTNTGSTALSIGSITSKGPAFQVSNTCGSSIAARAKCQISVVFAPKVSGPNTGLITILDSASSKPQFIEMAGKVTPVAFSAKDLNFGSQAVGTRSAAQVLTVTNNSTATVVLTKVGLGGIGFGTGFLDFHQTNTCGTQLAAGESCAFTVNFAPRQKGNLAATIYVEVEGDYNPKQVILFGTGS